MISKKKGLHQNWDWFFVQFRKFRRLRGAVFVWGGYFPFFTENRPQNHKKPAILHTSQANGGGSSPPPRPPPWLRYWMYTQSVSKSTILRLEQFKKKFLTWLQHKHAVKYFPANWPQRDSNPQSSDSKSDALSIRPCGRRASTFIRFLLTIESEKQTWFYGIILNAMPRF